MDEREKIMRVLEKFAGNNYMNQNQREFLADEIIKLLHPISEEEIEKIILNTCVQNSAKGIYVVDYENRILHSEILAHALSSRLLGGEYCECKGLWGEPEDKICPRCNKPIKPTQPQIEELKFTPPTLQEMTTFVDKFTINQLCQVACYVQETKDKLNEVIRTINREG